MALIKEWRKAWKYTTVQTAVILGLANAVFLFLPDLAQFVSFPVYAGIMALANVGIIVLRLIAQPKLHK